MCNNSEKTAKFSKKQNWTWIRFTTAKSAIARNCFRIAQNYAEITGPAQVKSTCVGNSNTGCLKKIWELRDDFDIVFLNNSSIYLESCNP